MLNIVIIITPKASKIYTMIDLSSGSSLANPNLYAIILKIKFKT